ncbi:MAG: hypothetical protein KC583_13630 [Myxococcales bacterium]|nr:hypothetical protein [Myxococcales bacterium]
MAFWRASLLLCLCTVGGGAASFAARALFGGSCLKAASAASDAEPAAIVRRPPHWEYVHPLLDCRSPLRADGPVEGLRSDLERLVAAATQGGVERVAVHLRDLGEGGALQVGDTQPFVLQRLALLPVMIARALHAERQPLYGAERGDVGWGRLAHITHVDRDLPELVLPVDPALITSVTRDLGWDAADPVPVSVVGHTFEVLFSATYLGRGTSEDALLRLAGAPREGIATGVPDDRPVARLGEPGEDCGIVYLPSRPYVLCVLTAGGSEAARAAVVHDVSTLVWARLAAATEKG